MRTRGQATQHAQTMRMPTLTSLSQPPWTDVTLQRCNEVYTRFCCKPFIYALKLKFIRLYAYVGR